VPQSAYQERQPSGTKGQVAKTRGNHRCKHQEAMEACNGAFETSKKRRSKRLERLQVDGSRPAPQTVTQHQLMGRLRFANSLPHSERKNNYEKVTNILLRGVSCSPALCAFHTNKQAVSPATGTWLSPVAYCGKGQNALFSVSPRRNLEGNNGRLGFLFPAQKQIALAQLFPIRPLASGTLLCQPTSDEKYGPPVAAGLLRQHTGPGNTALMEHSALLSTTAAAFNTAQRRSCPFYSNTSGAQEYSPPDSTLLQSKSSGSSNTANGLL